MGAKEIIYTGDIVVIMEEILKVRDNFNNLSLSLITRDDPVTSQYLRNLKIFYKALLHEVEKQSKALSKLSPADFANEHQILSNLFNELYDATDLATNSLDEKIAYVDVGDLVLGIKEQQRCVEEIQDTANTMVQKLTDVEF
ncbi:hypothetical protein [Priestia megaterium]|uniref:hypothetical protein n=1 Tax=Priestia megaterium TaxID=1404 RepID=UPI003D2E33D3